MPKVVCLIAIKISFRHWNRRTNMRGKINFAKRVLNIAENLIWLRRKLSVVELFCHFAKPEIDRDLRASQV